MKRVFLGFLLLVLLIARSETVSSQPAWVQLGTSGRNVGRLIDAPLSNYFFALTADTLYYSGDHGGSWRAKAFPTVGKLRAIGSTSKFVLLCADSGACTIYPAGKIVNGPFKGHMTTCNNEGLFGDDRGNIYLANSTWSKTALVFSITDSNLPNPIESIVTDYHQNHFVVTAARGIWKFTSALNHWDSLSDGPKTPVNDLMIGPEGQFFVYSRQYGALLSLDSGRSWFSRNSGLPDNIPLTAILSRLGYLYAGTSKGVYASNDYGATWRPYNSGIVGDSISQLIDGPGDSLTAMATDGRTFGLGSTIVGATPHFSSRIANQKSNLNFFASNDGICMNSGSGQAEGCFWPRGTTDAYLFGSGIWFGAEKADGLANEKFVEMSYDVNHGGGWFRPGETQAVEQGVDSISKYLNYDSKHFNTVTGASQLRGSTDPIYPWPIWTKYPNSANQSGIRNFQFGQYISKISQRDSLVAAAARPQFVSNQDILSSYTDQDSEAIVQSRVGLKYPIGIDVQQSIYSWGTNKYGDLVYIRYRITNRSPDTLRECYIAPIFDPDLGDPANDHVTSITRADSSEVRHAFMNDPSLVTYASNPNLLNMALAFSDPENAKEYGVIGFEFVETPIVVGGELIDIEDSQQLGGYGPGSAYQLDQRGLSSFRMNTLQNDPQNSKDRYAFIASGLLDHDAVTRGDMRIALSTGPFTLAPGRSATATVSIGIAKPSLTDRQANIDSLLRLMGHAHLFFADTSGSFAETGDPNATIIHQFIKQGTGAVDERSLAGSEVMTLWPNPASISTAVKFLTSSSSPSVLLFSDELGRVVSEVRLRPTGIGQHIYTWDCSNVPSGIYFCRCHTGSESKMTTIRVLH